MFCGDSGRIRTCNLPLRRGLLYPVEPRSLPLFILKTQYFTREDRILRFKKMLRKIRRIKTEAN